jgi:uncharacterized iron-regulated membrane protein
MPADTSQPRPGGRLREALFWFHLVSGLVAGLVIAVMSITGVAIAFEHEIPALLDRDVARVPARDGATRLPLDELVSAAAARQPAFRPTTLLVPASPTSAYELRAGREGTLFLNPYSGAVSEPRSGAAHDVLHALEEWHRWLGLEGRGQAVDKLVTGICNLALVVLCLTGIWIWLPRCLVAVAVTALSLLLAYTGTTLSRARFRAWRDRRTHSAIKSRFT